MRARVLFGMAFLSAASLVSIARADSLPQTWTVTGRHATFGDYTGKVTLKEDASGVTMSCDATTTDGRKLTWTGTGFRRANAIWVAMTLHTTGLAGALAGDNKATESAHGFYRLSPDGKSLHGTWRADKDLALKASENLSVAAPAPIANANIVKLVGADGKETAEECLAVNLAGWPGSKPLLQLDVKNVAGAPSDATITLATSARVALWKDASKSARVASGEKLANQDATLFVEGLAPSDPAVGETITATLASGATTIAQSSVVAHVARNAFHVAGHGSGGAYQTQSWLTTAKRDAREQPTFVDGKDEKTQKHVFYAVWIAQDQATAAVAMGCQDAFVSYDGHSNFGMGFAFGEGGYKRISDFFNIADPQVPVNWQYLREHQDHPDLMIDDSEYADDASTPEFSDPVQVGKNVVGHLGRYGTSRYPESGGSGTRLHLTRDKNAKWLDHHYGDPDNWRIVIKAGSADMPAKKWTKIYLHSCYSGQYYSDSFGGRGTLFFTHDEAQAYSSALPAFLRSCIAGLNNDDTLKAMNAAENLNDYIDFGH